MNHYELFTVEDLERERRMIRQQIEILEATDNRVIQEISVRKAENQVHRFLTKEDAEHNEYENQENMVTGN